MMLRTLLMALLAVAAIPASAQDTVVIYRCTDATGALSIQNDVPCPKGSQQQRQVMEAVHINPAAAPPPAIAPLVPLLDAPTATLAENPAATGSTVGTASAQPQAAADAPDNAPVDPPPALFSCRTWDRKEYFSDDPVPTRRCAPLRVSGLDGSAGSGNASACEYVTDSCTPVPDDALCTQWHQHAQDTRAMLVFGRAEDPAATRAELARIEAIILASTCRGGN